jgi:hypothetical protein
MTNDQLLFNRFIDQELTGDERLQLLLRLGKDEAFRQGLVDFERLVLDVSRLPRHQVPHGFAGRILLQTHDAASSPAVGRLRQWTEALWTPRALRWNLASALGAAAVVMIAVAALARTGWQTPPPVTQSGTALVAASAAEGPRPADGTQVLVRLVVLRPGARMVAAAGDFNGWNPSRTPLEQLPNGAWTVTIPLQPGRYEYMYVVDGDQWIADPFAVEQSDDGFGSRNAVLDVRPPTGSGAPL